MALSEIVQHAEERLIGAAIVDPKIFDEAALQYNNFYDPKKQAIWKAIGELRASGASVDEISIASQAKGISPSDLLDYTLGGKFPGSTANLASTIRNAHLERQISAMAAFTDTWKARGLNGEEILTKATQHLEALAKNNGRKLPTLEDVASEQLDQILSRRSTDIVGLDTGSGIERVVPGGVPFDKVTTIFSESGNFKTTLVGNFCTSFAKAGHVGLWCSFEDSDELTAIRALSGVSGINYGTLAAGSLAPSEKTQLADVTENDLTWCKNIILAGDLTPNIDEIIRTARYYKHERNLKFVVIDYIQLLEGPGRLSERELLNTIMRKAQLSAKRDGIAYIFVSQVKQDVDQRDDHRPRVTDMLGSSAMRTHSKLLIGVYRPSLYVAEPTKKSNPYMNLYHNHPEGADLYKQILELHVMKNVLGEAMVTVHCRVDPSTGVIEPFDMRPWL